MNKTEMADLLVHRIALIVQVFVAVWDITLQGGEVVGYRFRGKWL